MSTITKEYIADTIEGLEHLANSGIQSVYIYMAIAGMRRLMASLEAEPVYQVFYFKRWRDVSEEVFEAERKDGCQVRVLYTAPPEPVSVPDEIRLIQSDITIWKDRCEFLRELFREVADKLGCDVKDHEAMLDKIEMLQGKAGVSDGN